MKQIPNTENALVLRTDFSDQAAWEIICATIQEPVSNFHFRANVEFVDDTEYEGLAKDQLLQRLPKNYNHSFMIIADQAAMLHPDHPLLIVDLYNEFGREFRATPSQIHGIENNLSIANMDFEEFADSADEDGVFRGFQES